VRKRSIGKNLRKKAEKMSNTKNDNDYKKNLRILRIIERGRGDEKGEEKGYFYEKIFHT
jgi:hypothetical protein